eukprot:gene31232-37743_t
MSKGLFSQAILHSAYPQSYLPDAADALVTRAKLPQITNCDAGDLTCLQSLSTDDVDAAFGTLYIGCLGNLLDHYAYAIDKQMFYCGVGPEVGNSMLPGQIYDVFRSRTFNNVNMILGLAWNEGLADSNAIYNLPRSQAAELYASNRLTDSKELYIHWLNEISDMVSYEENAAAKTTLLSDTAKTLYRLYPYKADSQTFKDMYPNGYNGFSARALDASYLTHMLYHDWAYHCPLKLMARQHAAAQPRRRKNNPRRLYMYRFLDVPDDTIALYQDEYNSDPTTAVQNEFFSLNRYSTHSSDLPFVFPFTMASSSEGDAAVSNLLVES